MANNILPIVILLLVFGAAGLFLLQSRGGATMIMTESETKTSEYREEMVNKYITIIVYWLNGILLDNKPRVYQSDDLTLTFIDFGTQYGLISMTINWARNRARLHFAVHDFPSDSYGDTVMNVPLNRDAGFVKFCHKVEQIHVELMNGEKEVLNALNDLAAKYEAEPNEDIGDILISAYFLATQALSQQKHISGYSMAAYTRLAALIHNHYADKVAAIVKEYTESQTESD